MSVYDDISTAHVQLVNAFRNWGVAMTAQDLSDIQAAFQNIEAHATDSSAWSSVQHAHEVAAQILRNHINPSPAQLNELQRHMQLVSSWMPGPGGALKVIGNTFHDVVTSKAWAAIAAGAAFIPGVGPAVSAGMGAAYLVGKATEGTDQAFAAAGQAVAQYGGEDYKAGFDIGVGVAQGVMPSNDAATARASMSPEGQQGFDAALAVSAGKAIASRNPSMQAAMANMSGAQKSAYLATHGLVMSSSPASVKQSVAKLLAASPEGEKGLKAALAKFFGREISWLEWLWLEMKTVTNEIFAPHNKTVITVKGESVQ